MCVYFENYSKKNCHTIVTQWHFSPCCYMAQQKEVLRRDKLQVRGTVFFWRNSFICLMKFCLVPLMSQVYARYLVGEHSARMGPMEEIMRTQRILIQIVD